MMPYTDQNTYWGIDEDTRAYEGEAFRYIGNSGYVCRWVFCVVDSFF